MPSTILENVFSGAINVQDLVNWLNDSSNNKIPDESTLFCCRRSEFGAYFLSYIRSQTERTLQTNVNCLQALQRETHRNHRRSTSEPNPIDGKPKDYLKSNKTIEKQEITNQEFVPKTQSRRAKAKLFQRTQPLQKSKSQDILIQSDIPQSSTMADLNESKLSAGVSSPVTSTPIKSSSNIPVEFPVLPATCTTMPNENISMHSSFSDSSKEQHTRCDTPRPGQRNKTPGKKVPQNNLGDYILNAQPCRSSKKKKGSSKTHSNESISDLSQDKDLKKSDRVTEVPESSTSLDTRKCTTLNISDIKSSPLNTKLVEQPSEGNVALGQSLVQPSKVADDSGSEPNTVKQQRHKLMEKFNVLSIVSPAKMPSNPEIKMLKGRPRKFHNYVHPDINKITSKEKIEILVNIYEVILKNNLVLNISTEIYFLISILLSKQIQEDYSAIEADMGTNICTNLLRSIHNASYFAARTLWCQRSILELLLDKSSLKLLGENKHVRSFYPELAKYLLNLYGLKCDAELLADDDSDNLLENKYTDIIVSFNYETDALDNFPSVLCFQNFKKQRDLFYEIFCWWAEPENQGSTNRAAFRTRVKTLVNLGIAPENFAHLARLIRDHMVAECQEDKQTRSNNLHHRFAAESDNVEPCRLPKFLNREVFYRDLILYAENETFRVQLRDALILELLSLDESILLSDLRNYASPSPHISIGYLQVMKKLCLLGKFLGFMYSLPYTQMPADHAIKIKLPLGEDVIKTVPKGKILQTQTDIRNYIQPSFNIIDTLLSAHRNHRLSITIPWLVHYLVMLDYVTLRSPYFNNVLRILIGIYQSVLKIDSSTTVEQKTMKHNTIMLLNMCLGWLFEMPTFPQEVYHEPKYLDKNTTYESHQNISMDYFDLVNENVLFHICAYLREFNMYILTSRLSIEKANLRYIARTNITVNDAMDRKKNENFVEARLEKEFMKNQPLSTRRVIDMVVERVTSAVLKEIISVLDECKSRVNVAIINAKQECDPTNFVAVAKSLYQDELKVLHTRAMEAASVSVETRISMALKGLFTGNRTRASLQAVAKRSSLLRISKWIEDNWNNIGIFCKNLENVLRSKTAVTSYVTLAPVEVEIPDERKIYVSPYLTLINMRNVVNNLHYGESITFEEVLCIIEDSRQCCLKDNVHATTQTITCIHKTICEMVVVCIAGRPEYVTPELFQKVDEFWNIVCPDRVCLNVDREPLLEERDFSKDDRCPTPISDDESPAATAVVKCAQNVTQEPKKTEPPVNKNPLLKIFDRTFCTRNVLLLSKSTHPQQIVWQKMADYLTFLLKNNYLSEDSLAEQCLAVYREDWSQDILKNLSLCMRLVSDQWGRSSGGKFTLFLDFLAEYCNDMDYEQDVSIVN